MASLFSKLPQRPAEGWRRAGRERFRASLKGRSVAYYAGSSLISQAMRFLGMVLATRLLVPEEFGAFAQVVLIMAVACLPRDLGLSNALIAYVGQERRYARFHFQSLLVSSHFCAGLVMGLPKIWSGLAPGVAELTGWLAATVVLEGLALTGTVMAQKSFRFKALAGVEISATAGWLALIALGGGRLPGLTLLVAARFAEVLIRTVLVGVLETRKHVGFTADREMFGYYFRFARYGAPQALVENIISQIDTLLLTAFSSVYQLGLYDRIQQFSRIPLSLSINLLDRVALVSFSQHQNEPDRLRRLLRWFACASLGAAALVVCLLTFLLPTLLERMLGHAWMLRLTPHWWAAVPLMLLRPTVWLLNIFMQGIGNTKALIRFMIYGLVISCVAGVILVPGFGAAGMLLAQGVAHLILLIYQVAVIARWLGARSPRPSLEV